MSNQFLQAAASYFGLAETNLRKAECFTDGGEVVMAFEIRMMSGDLIAIGERMQVLAQEETTRAPDDTKVIDWGQTIGQMRDQYNALTPSERSRYGSFARFCAGTPVQSVGANGRDVKHVEVEEEPAQIDVVWVRDGDATDTQQRFASDYDKKKGFLVQVAMLTPEQKARYVQPTSNADDFGGLPG